MNKRIIQKWIAILLVCFLAFSLMACGKKGLEKVSEDLSDYTVQAAWNDTDKTLTAQQTVRYMNQSGVELNEVWFHLYPNAYREKAKITPVTPQEVADAYPEGIDYGGITVSAVTVEGTAAAVEIGGEDENILIVRLSKPLMPFSRVQIGLNYTVKVPRMRHRLGHYNKTVNLGNWYPVACVYEQGAFRADPYYANGDPFYLNSANFVVSITAPKKYTAAMSGQAFRKENSDGTATTQANIKAARDYAICLGEFDVLSENVNGVAVNYYYYNDKTPQQSLDAAVDSLKTFSEKFSAYPYASLSVAQTVFLQGGMEYTGMEFISDAVTGELYREVIIHETAHQWWFGLVGNSQIDDAWMDEALAEYSTTLFYELNPSYNVKYEDRIADAMSGYALYCDINKPEDTSMDRRLNAYKTGSEYTYMTYVKGQLLFDALRKAIGDKALFEGLKRYSKDYSFLLAKPDDMIGSFEKAAGVELKGFFDSWTEGKVLLFGEL